MVMSWDPGKLPNSVSEFSRLFNGLGVGAEVWVVGHIVQMIVR